MKLEIPVKIEFDDVTGIIEEIKGLQTYKLFEDDDMLLVDLDDVADILANHIKAKQNLTTTWLGNYTPYQCSHCGKHTDSKTPFCAWCGRRASNYEV